MKVADTRETIIGIKKIVAQRGLKPQDILEIVEERQLNISLSSIRRICADGSENINFDFQNIVAPIANLLVDVDEQSAEDSPEVALMKGLILAKIEIIERQDKEISDLKLENLQEKQKHHERIEKINDEHLKEMLQWMHQIELKDTRMDKLFASNEKKDAIIDEKEAKIAALEKKIEELITEIQDILKKCKNCKDNIK